MASIAQYFTNLLRIAFVATGSQLNRAFELLGLRQFKIPVGRQKANLEIAQNKKWLDKNILGLSRPIEFDYLRELEYLMSPINIRKVAPKSERPAHFLVFVPHYFMEILFGGYLAFFDFLRRIKEESDGDLELVIVRRIRFPRMLERNLARMQEHHPEIASLFTAVHYLPDVTELEIVGKPGIISYCAETHYAASYVAETIGVKPIFFIQDYEPDFHAAGSLKTFVKSSFELPHIGVYNSSMLLTFFRRHSDIDWVRAPDYRCISLENTIKPMPWAFEYFHSHHTDKNEKRLIIYGRPEPHGARNEFAILVLALRQAIRLGYINDRDWSFYSIGALATEDELELSKRAKLKIMAKMPYEEYQNFLLLGDVGISVISTPHPGIIHFQMASYGLVSITNTTPLRTPEWLKAQSGNLIGTPLALEEICEAIRSAVERADDYDTRYRNAIESAASKVKSDVEKAVTFALSEGYQVFQEQLITVD